MSSAEWDMFYGAKHELVQYQMNPNGTKYEGFCKCLVGEKDLQKPCIIFVFTLLFTCYNKWPILSIYEMCLQRIRVYCSCLGLDI